MRFEQLTKYCKRNEVNVIKHYREDHSAKDFNRPQFQNFLQYVKSNKGKIDTLLITSWDRFSRNLTDASVEPQPHLSNQAKQDLRKLIAVLEVDNGDIYMDE